VEDIIDSGHTLDRLARDLRAAGAASVKVCAINKSKVEVMITYVIGEV
jgi:hypoxanthine-guanine phosphoribosyltransferase